MALRLVGIPHHGFPAHYRGVARFPPTHLDDLPDEHPANVAYLEMLDKSNGSGALSEDQRQYALDYVAQRNRDDPSERIEVIQVASRAATPSRGSELLGYDLTIDQTDSLLSWAERPAGAPAEADAAAILSGLIREHYRPRLNRHGLFGDVRTADECLESIQALQSLRPATFEIGHYAVMAILLVRASD